MTRHLLILLFAGLALSPPATALAQTAAPPGNVVAPPPAPREGTVGPEQLRDFALPGTRQPSQPAAEAPRPAVPAPTPAPATTTPPPAAQRPATAAPAGDSAARAVREAPEATAAARPATPEAPLLAPATPAPRSSVTAAQPVQSQPLPPITLTQPDSAAPSLLPGWWPWLLAAMLAGVGLAMVRRHRRRPAFAGHEEEVFARDVLPPAPAPAPPRPPAPVPAPPPAAAPALPTGVVTTRLRQPPAMRDPLEPVAPLPPPPGAVAGGIVSTRLRAWIDLDLRVREIRFEAREAILLVDFIMANSGSTAARDITLEAVIINGGEGQAAELATFFERPAAARAALPELGPLNDSLIAHDLRLPRENIRAYDVAGKPMFVPVVALTAAYRTGTTEARTGAAFLIGRAVPGADRLAPLPLLSGAGRQAGLGTRRLEEAVRR